MEKDVGGVKEIGGWKEGGRRFPKKMGLGVGPKKHD
jgi:hypothetical protein